MLRCLIVGVDRYRMMSADYFQFDSLRGAVNDAHAVHELMRTTFAEEGIDARLLVNESATRDTIIEHLEVMLSSASPSDRLLFYFAGHGSVDADQEHPGEYRQVLCTHDIDWATKTFISDQHLKRVVDECLGEGRTLEVIFDSCHAGGMDEMSRLFNLTTPFWRLQLEGLRLLGTSVEVPLLGAREVRSRFLAPPLSVVEAIGSCPPDRIVAHRFDQTPLTGAAKKRCVLWSATRIAGVAEEVEFDGLARGAFTQFLCSSVRADSRASRDQVLCAISTALTGLKMDQQPSLLPSSRLIGEVPLLDNTPL